MSIEVQTVVIKSGTPSADVRIVWDQMVQNARACRNVEFRLLMPENVQLVSRELSTIFTRPGGGYASIRIDENDQWHMRSKPTPLTAREIRRQKILARLDGELKNANRH